MKRFVGEGEEDDKSTEVMARRNVVETRYKKRAKGCGREKKEEGDLLVERRIKEMEEGEEDEEKRERWEGARKRRGEERRSKIMDMGETREKKQPTPTLQSLGCLGMVNGGVTAPKFVPKRPQSMP